MTRFGPGTYDNPVGKLSKLRQTSTVRLYQEQFEALVARTRGLPEDFFVQCFVSGLKDAIKNQVGHVSVENASSSSWVGLVTREYLGGNDQRSQGFNKNNILPCNPYSRIETQFYRTNSSNQKNICCKNAREEGQEVVLLLR